MTYPVDQIVNLLKANGQLALKLAEIARTSGEEYLQIGSKAANGFAGQIQDIKPGQFPGFKSEAGTAILSDLEKSREETLLKVKTAVEDWQSTWKDVVSDTSAPKELTDKFQGLLQPQSLLQSWSGLLSAATSAATPVTPGKPAQKAPPQA